MNIFRRRPVLLTSLILLLAIVPLLGWGCSSGSSTAGSSKQAGSAGADPAKAADSSGNDAQLVKLDFSLPKAALKAPCGRSFAGRIIDVLTEAGVNNLVVVRGS